MRGKCCSLTLKPLQGRKKALSCLSFVLLVALLGEAQTFTVLYKFDDLDGAEPQSALLRDSAGNLYGTAEYGGASGNGVVFEIGVSAKVLYSFGDVPDGARPFSSLTGGVGTTYTGGIACASSYSCGTVYKIDNGTDTVIYRFQGSPDGANPNSAVIHDLAGNLFGTTVTGGDSNCDKPFGCGVVYKLDSSGNETILYTFHGAPDGDSPYGSLLMDSAGNLYGTTAYGGVVNASCPIGCGTIFKLTMTSGGWTKTVLHNFSAGSDGANPYAGLIRDSSGNFYGATAAGGTAGKGTVFRLNSSLKVTVLYSFTGGADGSEPFAPLVRDAAGNLYGTTVFGGTTTSNCFLGCGTVFEIAGSSREKVLHSFTDNEGMSPFAGLLLDSTNRVLYGTASLGGNLNCNSGSGDGVGCGSVFKIDF